MTQVLLRAPQLVDHADARRLQAFLDILAEGIPAAAGNSGSSFPQGGEAAAAGRPVGQPPANTAKTSSSSSNTRRSYHYQAQDSSASDSDEGDSDRIGLGGADGSGIGLDGMLDEDAFLNSVPFRVGATVPMGLVLPRGGQGLPGRAGPDRLCFDADEVGAAGRLHYASVMHLTCI